jgi:hypothetical protein
VEERLKEEEQLERGKSTPKWNCASTMLPENSLIWGFSLASNLSTKRATRKTTYSSESQ